MGKNKKPKCVMVLTEGPSDRAALTGLFTDLYSLIDDDIEVFFPVYTEESLTSTGALEANYNGDITSRTGITPENILPMLLKMFIHPELKKHPAYEYPKYVYEVIHLVDIDGVYLDDDRIVNAAPGETRELPYYDDQTNTIIVKDRDSFIRRNQRKRENLAKLVETSHLQITTEKDASSKRDKPYSVFFFSSNLDHVLFGKANNASFNKVQDARKFSNDFYGEPLKQASYFINHPGASPESTYSDSWATLFSDSQSIRPRTNINLLIKRLLEQAKVKELPLNDIRDYC
ncbi:MAG: hypothetical protein K5891_06880 [Lachnospiraceae bacterium]|nr:hypothetical protein [Lachnospiraceae bacterium]